MPAASVTDALDAAGISLRCYTLGTHRAACPKCNKSKDTALSVTNKDDSGVVWNCHRCNFAGGWRPGAAAMPLRLTINGAAFEYKEGVPMRAQAEVAMTAQAIWDAAVEASGDHPYLTRKNVLAHGLKQQDGYLLVPMRDMAGELYSIQRIGVDGSKLFPKDARTTSCFHLLGSPNRVLYVCEGYATAASIHEATGDAAIAVFSANNLAPVAAAWRLKLPDARIIIAADNDHKTAGNPGLVAAQAAAIAVGGVVAAPDIADLPDGGTDWNDVAAHIGLHQIPQRLEAAMPVPSESAAMTGALPLVTYANAKPQLDALYLVKGWILAGELSATTGAPGCGKTFMGLDIDAHIAAGIDWFGYRVRQMAVVYLAAEGGTAIFNRIAALRRRFGYDDSLPLSIIPAGVDLVSGQAGPAAVVAAIKRAEAIFGRPVGKITIDTLSRVLAGADENSSEAMGGLIKAVDAIRAATGAHLTLVHHTPKVGTPGKGGRGHSSLWGAIDTEISVERDITTRIATAKVVKQRNGPEGAETSFELEPVLLGTDSDGDAVSSCIIIPASGEKQAINVKLSATCAIALSALRQAIDENGEIPPANNHIPVNIRAVQVELWRKYAYQRAISSEGPDARRKAFKRASEQLQARGIVTCWGDFVWSAS